SEGPHWRSGRVGWFMVDRDYEMDSALMVAKMENVASRANDVSAAARKAFRPGAALSITFQERALSLVAECAELGCPPPRELLDVLYLVFEPNSDRRAAASDETRVAGEDKAGLIRRYQQRLIAESYGVKINSVHKFE